MHIATRRIMATELEKSMQKAGEVIIAGLSLRGVSLRPWDGFVNGREVFFLIYRIYTKQTTLFLTITINKYFPFYGSEQRRFS